jgi:hypothetical protein
MAVLNPAACPATAHRADAAVGTGLRPLILVSSDTSLMPSPRLLALPAAASSRKEILAILPVVRPSAG